MKKGFTLIELLTVVLIVAILTAVGLPQYGRVVQKSNAAEGQSMLRSIYDSSERLANEFGYRSYAKLIEYKGATGFGFNRLDMFDANNLPSGCRLQDDGHLLSCKRFDYKIATNNGGGYVAAKMKVKPKDVLLLLDRNTLDLLCQGTEDQCDTLGLDRVSGVSF